MESSEYEVILTELLQELFEAEAAYGTGFYSDERWLGAYRELKEMVGN